MSETRTITGHTVVMVKTTDGEVPLHRGDTLPDNLAVGELARLEKVGAFADPPVADLAAQGARPAVLIAPALGGSISAQEALQAAPDVGGPAVATPSPDGRPLLATADVHDAPLVDAAPTPTPVVPPAPPAAPAAGTPRKSSRSPQS